MTNMSHLPLYFVIAVACPLIQCLRQYEKFITENVWHNKVKAVFLFAARRARQRCSISLPICSHFYVNVKATKSFQDSPWFCCLSFYIHTCLTLALNPHCLLHFAYLSTKKFFVTAVDALYHFLYLRCHANVIKFRELIYTHSALMLKCHLCKNRLPELP